MCNEWTMNSSWHCQTAFCTNNNNNGWHKPCHSYLSNKQEYVGSDNSDGINRAGAWICWFLLIDLIARGPGWLYIRFIISVFWNIRFIISVFWNIRIFIFVFCGWNQVHFRKETILFTRAWCKNLMSIKQFYTFLVNNHNDELHKKLFIS